MIQNYFAASLFLITCLPVLGQDVKSVNFQVVRDENNGRMNSIPCFVSIFASTGTAIEPLSVVDQERPTEVKKPYMTTIGVSLIGGQIANYALRPGKYRLAGRTPISSQGHYLEESEHDWVSPELAFEIELNGEARFYVVPTSKGASYSGGWQVKKLPEPDQDFVERLKSSLIGASPSYFHSQDTFTYIGKVLLPYREYFLVYSSYYWGNGRATNRLSLLDGRLKYLGNYGKLDITPSGIVTTQVVFDTDHEPKYGYKFDLADGPPPRIYIDGEFYEFQK